MPISLVNASISSCVGLFALCGVTVVVGVFLVSSTSGSFVRLWESESWVPLGVGLEDLLSEGTGLLNEVSAATTGTFWETTAVFWEALGAEHVAATVVVLGQVLVLSTNLEDSGKDLGISLTLAFPPDSAGAHLPSTEDVS